MAVPSNPYPALARAIDPAIVRSIRQASQGTSTDFGLLMAQAQQESGFKPGAKAAGGSASGLFQFVDSTWLDMMHRFGAKYGAGAAAQQITLDASGKPEVADPAARQKILAMRSDPTLSASLAGEYAKLNKDEVERAIGRPAGAADLYMAHFLGAGGASEFLKALDSNGATPAAELLPEAAASNHNVFYDSTTGQAKSVAEIYRQLGGKVAEAAQQFADLMGGSSGDPAASSAAFEGSVPSSAGTGSGTGTSGLVRGLNFAGLTLSQPVAAMMDTLTLAALRLMNGAPASGDQHRPNNLTKA